MKYKTALAWKKEFGALLDSAARIQKELDRIKGDDPDNCDDLFLLMNGTRMLCDQIEHRVAEAEQVIDARRNRRGVK